MAEQRRRSLQEELLQLGDRPGGPSPLALTGPNRPSAEAASTTSFRIAPGRDFGIFRFDDGTVVFSRHSWDTHYLNEAAALVLDFVAEEPRTAADVGRFMAELLRPEEQEAAADHARGVLNELLALRLVVAGERGTTDDHR